MGEKIVDEDKEMVLPGFRFHPTDEELVGFYLRRKIEKRTPPAIEIIKQIDIYKYDPWDLTRESNFGENEWYFFSKRGRKYRNSVRPNRVTCSGFWKATGIDRPVFSGYGNCIGLKKSLVYYRGSAGKGTKTDWMMHEFRLPSCNSIETSNNEIPPSINESESWTICRIFMRNVSFKKYTEQMNSKETESSSKTSCFESDAGEMQRNMNGECSYQREESFVNKTMEEDGKLSSGGDWNSDLQKNRMNLQSNFVNLNDDEFFREEDWDEMGRMVDYMIEPASTYDCIYF